MSLTGNDEALYDDNMPLSFAMGERVEARMSPDYDFRSAIIVGVHRNGLYDVTFDDNGKECCDLHPNNLRKGTADIRDDGGTSLTEQNSISFVGRHHVASSRAPPAERYSKGETVEVMRGGGCDWRLAVIAKVHEPPGDQHGDACYDVIYSDHFREEKVSSLFMRRMYGQEPAVGSKEGSTEPKTTAHPTDLVAFSPSSSRPHQSSSSSTSGRARDAEQRSKPAARSSARASEEGAFFVGQRVEARYHGGKLYYSGVVSQVVNARYVDVLYDDGDAESSVPVEYVRTAAEISQPAVSAGEDYDRCQYHVGTKVEANFQGCNKWYPGTIESARRVNGAARYAVSYNDGDREDNVPEDMVRPLGTKLRLPSTSREPAPDSSAANRIEPLAPSKPPSQQSSHRPSPHKQVHRRVLDQSGDFGAADMFASSGNHAVAEAKEIRTPNGRPHISNGSKLTLNQSSDNGSVSNQSSPVLLHQPAPSLSPQQQENIDMLTSIRVSVNYHESGQWYSGRILREREEGFVDIVYDDQEVEQHVSVDNIKLLSYTGAPNKPQSSVARAPSAQLKAGDRVECDYQGSGAYYPGSVMQVYQNAQKMRVADVCYDDGEKETTVPLHRLRHVQRAGQRRKTSAPPHDSLSSEDRLSLCLGSLVEVRDGDKYQLARISGMYFDGQELFDVKFVYGNGVRRGLSLSMLRLPRSSRPPDQSAPLQGVPANAIATQGLVVSPEELQALKILLQHKDRQIQRLKAQQGGGRGADRQWAQDDFSLKAEHPGANGASPSKLNDLSKASNPNSDASSPVVRAFSKESPKPIAPAPTADEVNSLRKEVADLRKTVGVLGQKFSLLVGEVVSLKQSEDKLKKQIKQQTEHLRSFLSAAASDNC